MNDVDIKRGVDFTGVNCAFYCFDDKGRILLNKRSTKCRDEHGRWDAGAGAMEFGEDFEETVRREVREEYCAEILQLEFAGMRSVVRDNNGVKTHWVTAIFAAQVDPASVGIGDPIKMEEIGWFSVDELPEPMHSQFHHNFEIVRKNTKLPVFRFED